MQGPIRTTRGAEHGADPTTRRRARVALAALLAAGVLATAFATPARAQDGGSSTTVPRATTSPTTVPRATTSSTTPGRSSAQGTPQPTGQVAYVTADGRVLIGNGNAEPKQVATGAALGPAGQAAVAVAPTADLVAFVRTDGTLVTVPIDGGDPTVVATDVAVAAVGADPVIAWNSTGDELAYVAVGTQAQVRDRGSRPRVPSDPKTFAVPLPEGVLGNTVRTATKAGAPLGVIGDPSLRSFVGVNWSPSDPFLLLDSVIPGTSKRYTLSIGASGGAEEVPTPLSVDDPDFSPDGAFAVAVGPAKGKQELNLITFDDLKRTTLVIDDRICNPAVSPDASRIVYGAGPGCSRLMLISSRGGQQFDITPLDAPQTTTFGAADVGWTTDGRYVTFPTCRTEAGKAVCGGPTTFLEPDTGRTIPGPEATTVAPVRRPLVQDVWVDVDLRGPLKFRHSFLISAETQAKLVDNGATGSIAEAKMVDGSTSMTLRLTAGSNAFVTGTLEAVDPDKGINRTFMIIGRPNLIGVRIFSLSGTWYSTDDLPFATGRFNMAIRRR